MLPPANKITQRMTVWNQNVRIVIGRVLVFQMFQKFFVAESLLIVSFVVHIIVVWKSQQIPGEVFHGRKLFIPRKYVVSGAYLSVRMDIGKGVMIHHGIFRWLFVGNDAQCTLYDFATVQNAQPEHQPRERKVCILRIVINHVCP